MKNIKRTVYAFSAAALLAAPSYALAQDPPAAQQPPPAAQERPAEAAAAASTASGELVKVDADAKSLTIKSADGQSMQFTYTDATEVAGARDGVAGLATKAGIEGKRAVHREGWREDGYQDRSRTVTTSTALHVETFRGQYGLPLMGSTSDK